MRLIKEQINSIKYFFRCEEEKHKYGDWDKIKITSLRIHADGYYSFKVHYMYIYNGVTEDYWVEGNLFEEFPICAVLDGLDVVQLIFHVIHIKAYERKKREADKDIKQCNEHFNYLCNIYVPGGAYNKEGKNIVCKND